MRNGFFFHEIVFGDPEAIHTLTIVIHFKCVFCAKVMFEVNKLISTFSDIKINVRFGNPAAGRELNEYITKSIIYLALKDLNIAKEAILDWADVVILNSSKEKWEEKYSISPAIIDTEDVKIVYKKYLNWYSSVGLNYSPAMFFDGKFIPKVYQINNLKVFFRWMSHES